MVPFVVLVLLLAIWHLFRVSAAFGLMSRCAPTHEFWTTTIRGQWPLLGAFALVVLLLMAWCLAHLANAGLLLPSDRRLLVFSTAICAAVLYGFWAIFGAIQLEYADDSGALAWNATSPFWAGIQEECKASKPFLGKWRITSFSLPSLEEPLPYSTVTISRNLSVLAESADRSISHAGWFGPPGTNFYDGDVGWISAGRLSDRWKFTLVGERLHLESRHDHEDRVRVVVLERIR